jgi:hypothetical protein
MAALLLRVSSLNAGALIIFILPESSASGDSSDQPVIPFRIKVKSATILGFGTSRAEKTLAFAYRCWTTELEPASLFFLTPINYLKASHAGIATIFRKSEGV